MSPSSQGCSSSMEITALWLWWGSTIRCTASTPSYSTENSVNVPIMNPPITSPRPNLTCTHAQETNEEE